MKLPAAFILLTASLFVSMTSFQTNRPAEDDLSGAWSRQQGSEEEVLLFVDGYYTYTSFDRSAGKFNGTRGGTFKSDKGKLVILYEFDNRHPDLVGTEANHAYIMKDDVLTITINGRKQEYKRIDQGKAPLAGVWHITQRMQDGKLVPIHRSGTRKTLKILSGQRFQWAAIDPGAKTFSGTGGGSYTFRDGTYTEHIEFFSRDSSRVGASLSFEGRLENGDWHHSGLSSKGEKIYEVWSRMNR